MEEQRHRSMTPLRAAMWTMGLWLLENVCVQITEGARPGAIADVVNLAICQVLATSIAVFAIVRVHAPEASLRMELGLRPVGPVRLVLSAVAGAGLYPAISTINDAVVRRWPYAASDSDAVERLLSLPSQSARIALVVAAFVLMPLTRELFFRGVLFTELRRAVSEPLAVVASALCFAGASLDWRTMPTSLLLGLALVRIRVAARSVLASIAAHVAFWAVEGIPILRGRSPTADVAYSLRSIVGGAAVATLAFVLLGVAPKARE
ncbi:MAG: CPBP family intramembrane metalloprotease [Myxococcota bacterium]|nr:CPBP family intramembrane metalloprotease [Myxococcota bacterium]